MLAKDRFEFLKSLLQINRPHEGFYLSFVGKEVDRGRTLNTPTRSDLIDAIFRRSITEEMKAAEQVKRLQKLSKNTDKELVHTYRSLSAESSKAAE